METSSELFCKRKDQSNGKMLLANDEYCETYQQCEPYLCLQRYRAKPAMIMAIKGTRMAAATELLLDAKLYPGLSLLGSKLSGGKRDERHPALGLALQQNMTLAADVIIP